MLANTQQTVSHGGGGPDPAVDTIKARTAVLPGAPVAIFDDDVVYIRTVERMLRVAGVPSFGVTTFDVDEAARVIAAAGCRAVLVDVFLYDEPRGFACIDRLRSLEATADLPLLVTSGARRQLQRMATYLTENRCALLEKPFGPDALLEKLEAAASLIAQAPVQGAPSVRPGG